MFRINVYRLVDERRRRTVARAKRLAAMATLGGVCAVFLVFFGIVIALQLREIEARQIELQEAKTQADAVAREGRVLPRTRYAFLERKVAQSPWWPVFEALSENAPAGLRLREVRLRAPVGAGGVTPAVASFQILGSVAVRSGSDPTELVVRFHEALRADPRMGRTVCDLRIGSADASPYDPMGTYDFELIGRACGPEATP